MSITKSYNRRLNITYVYDTTYVWSEERKRKVQKRKCIGHVDPVTGETKPNGKVGRRPIRKKEDPIAEKDIEKAVEKEKIEKAEKDIKEKKVKKAEKAEKAEKDIKEKKVKKETKDKNDKKSKNDKKDNNDKKDKKDKKSDAELSPKVKSGTRKTKRQSKSS